MRGVIQILGMVFYPLIVHLLIKLDSPWLAVAGLVVASFLYLLLAFGFSPGSQPRPAWAGMYLFLTVLGIINLLTDTHYALYVPPVVINLALALYFGMTLRAGAVPLVVQMMCHEYRGNPPPPIQAYGRRVTWTWVVYFTAVALTSLVLAFTVALETWSLFANVLNYVFAVLLLFGQYCYRILRYRRYGVFMPWDTLRAMARVPGPGRTSFTCEGNQAPK